jgi:hypothetical protein
MPFRKVTYKVSCAACPQLTEDLCPICQAPACSTHLGAEMCTHCSTAFAEKLAAANLSFDDLKFGTPPDDDAPSEELEAWNERSARAYQARFLLVRLRKARRRYSVRAKKN